MRHLLVWVTEFIKLLGGRRLHPLRTHCPICQQTVHLHVNKAGRRHVFAHARRCLTALASVYITTPLRQNVPAPARRLALIRGRANTCGLSCRLTCFKHGERHINRC